MSAGISRSQGFINCIRRRILLLLVNSSPIWHCIPDIHHPGSNKRPKRVENRRQRHFLFCLPHWIPPYWSFFVTWKPKTVKCPSGFPDPPESKENIIRRRELILSGDLFADMASRMEEHPIGQRNGPKGRGSSDGTPENGVRKRPPQSS